MISGKPVFHHWLGKEEVTIDGMIITLKKDFSSIYPSKSFGDDIGTDIGDDNCLLAINV